jgi:membrane-associated phospholipid phosphatase
MDRSALDLIDRSTLMYTALVIAIVVWFRQRIPGWPFELGLLTSAAAVAILVAWIAATSHSRTLQFVRTVYPLALFSFFYTQTGRLNHILFERNLDHLPQRLDALVFGFQPSLRFAQAAPQLWLAEYLHFAYFSYYLMLPAAALLLWSDPPRVRDYMFALCNTFYACYLTFIVLPIYGPPVFGVELFSDGLLFVPIMRLISSFDIRGAALPSSHVAATCVVLFYMARYRPRSMIIFGPLGLSLMVATVYCGYHYVVDVVAGIALAAAVIPLSRRYVRRRSRIATMRSAGSTAERPASK